MWNCLVPSHFIYQLSSHAVKVRRVKIFLAVKCKSDDCKLMQILIKTRENSAAGLKNIFMLLPLNAYIRNILCFPTFIFATKQESENVHSSLEISSPFSTSKKKFSVIDKLHIRKLLCAMHREQHKNYKLAP